MITVLIVSDPVFEVLWKLRRYLPGCREARDADETVGSHQYDSHVTIV
jgi:hypothetical protein